MIDRPTGISLLICTYNGASRLSETLKCIAQQAVPSTVVWEVILVDNASVDGTTELAQRVWKELGAPVPLYLLHEPTTGKQFALERAIGQVQYSYTCIVDDDNRLANNYLREGLAILEANLAIGILGGPNEASFEGEEPVWFKQFQHCYAVGPQIDRVNGNFVPLSDGNVGRNVLWGAGMFVRTVVWDLLKEANFQSMCLGRLGQNLTGGEDDELCYVAQLLGYEVWYSSRLHLRHHMAAGRLTEAYRNRLFYGSVGSAVRLNAYRNALWGKQGGNVGINLLKDAGYALLGIARNVFSLTFVRSSLSGNPIARMNQWHAFSVVKDSLMHFGTAKAFYQQVLQLKHKLQTRASTSLPVA